MNSLSECQPEAVQLITPSDVVDSSLLYGSEFEDILTVTEQNSVLLWGDNDIPNEGNLTFQQPFLLLAMTSMGDRITDNRFISNFSLQYSDSLNGSFHTYPRVSNIINISINYKYQFLLSFSLLILLMRQHST